MLDTAKIVELKAMLRGQLILPSDATYEEARALYNGMIDKRPLAIARCTDVADVIAAVNFGRKARPNMIATLDSFRNTLEDLGGGLGVTDPVSGSVVLSLK